MDEHSLHCPNCEYNLTGLTVGRCPECGTIFDLEQLRSDTELRRSGSPVYRKRGLELIPRTVSTLFIMLFRPRSFAQRLRFDEPLGPALAVFLFGLSSNVWILLGLPFGTGWRWRFSHAWRPTVVLIAVMALLILVSAFAFAAASVRGSSRVWTLSRRFRFWFIVAMYTMIFAPVWPWLCAGTWALRWRDYTTDWPFFYLYHSNEAYPASMLLLWWTLVISVVLWYRSRPRWLAIVLMLAAFVFVRSIVQVVDGFIPRLAR